MTHQIKSNTILQAKARLIAFYLPQFHQIPENDKWWGYGFTEWTNVRKAKALFESHNQPRRAGDLGYYNLLDQDIREKQARIAKEHGIESFCYWHYWFGSGRRLLEKPFEQVLNSKSPDFGFCLCWANQTWTGVWHGAPNRILIEQTYPGQDDERRHFESILPALQDARYTKIDNRPIFAIYKPEELPDAGAFITHWTKLARKAGLTGIYFIGMSNKFDSPELAHFDACMPIGPGDYIDGLKKPSFALRAIRKVFRGKLSQFTPGWLMTRLGFPARYDYATAARTALARLPRERNFLPCVLTGWDNTPRSGRRGVVFEHYDPPALGEALNQAITFVSNHVFDQRVVFLKAWNEWAEGNYIEPDAEYGYAYLQAISKELGYRGEELTNVPPPTKTASTKGV